ncbi:unnamed protein product [Arctogadus glacialis]
MQTRSSTTNTHWYRHIRALYSNNRQYMSTGHSNTTGPNHVFKAKTNELSTGNEVEGTETKKGPLKPPGTVSVSAYFRNPPVLSGQPWYCNCLSGLWTGPSRVP